MRWKKYSYLVPWSGSFTPAYRPLIQVTLRNNDSFFSPLSLIDSGSDLTLISYEIANELKIKLAPCKEVAIGGIGNAKGKICDVILEIPDLNVKRTITAIFVQNLPFSVLLGQRDFFEEVDVRFEKKNNKFYLRKV